MASFVRAYEAEFEDIKMEEVRKEPNFEVREYKEEGLLHFYFGQIKNGNKHGKGILITPGYLFEGVWKFGEKVKGVEVTSVGKYKG